jgi:hypothetical protein
MAEKNLQSLVLRAAPLAGARATGLESKVVFMAKQDNSAQALSFPWHPLAGRPAVRTGPEADKVRRDYSTDLSVRRAGRSASVRGVQIGIARSGSATILWDWSCVRGTAASIPEGCAGSPASLGHGAMHLMHRHAMPMAAAEPMCG